MFHFFMGQKATEAYNSQMIRFSCNILGMRVRGTELPRLLAIFGLDSIGLWRSAIAKRFCIRMIEQRSSKPDMSI